MKLRSIQISNIRSFATTSEPIVLEDDRPNIIIGPNGSGKSNLVEIINQIFTKVFFCEYTLNYGSSINEQSRKQTIIQDNTNIEHLIANRNSEDKGGGNVKLSVLFEESDIKNLEYIKSISTDLTNCLAAYSNKNIDIFLTNLERTDKKYLMVNQKDIEIDFIYGQQITATVQVQNIWTQYLENYELINRAIDLINANGDGSNTLNNLKPTFLLKGASRIYSGFPLSFSRAKSKTDLLNEKINTVKGLKTSTLGNYQDQSNGNSIFFQEFIDKGYIAGKKHGKEEAEKAVRSALEEDETIKYLKKHSGLSFDLKDYIYETHTFEFCLKQNNGEVPYNSLSSGEKSIIDLLLTLGMFNVNDGIVIIDEPELHLHPRLQRQYKDIIEKFSKDRKLQIILVTHSPAFVDEVSIPGVIRLYKDDSGNTKSVKSNVEASKTKDLIQYLSYTNSSKIFFEDRILLVEGISDEYFFRAFIEKKFPGESIGVLSIDGKDSHKRWMKFLEGWKIQSFFLGDYDCVIKLKIAESKDYKVNSLENKIKTKRVIKPFNLEDQKKQKQIDISIKEKYKEGIYILKRGELEDYLGVEKHDLDGVIKFCANDFPFVLNSEEEQELQDILTNVV